jgi:hypothetical protein
MFLLEVDSMLLIGQCLSQLSQHLDIEGLYNLNGGDAEPFL